MLYLASASPRRHELLNQIGISHTVLAVPAPAGADEPLLADESPLYYVQRTAADKLQYALHWRATQNELQQDWAILCADTTVELAGEVLGKPHDLAHAAELLKQLSGREHQVHTACVLYYQEQQYSALSTSTVQFKPLSDAEIDWYCQSGEPLGKAGAYGIQGKAAVFIAQLQGSYSGVMGLDVFQTYQLLCQAGLSPLSS